MKTPYRDGLKRLTGSVEGYEAHSLARLLGVCSTTIWDHARKRGWRGYGRGRQKLYAKADVDAYLDERRDGYRPPNGWMTYKQAMKLLRCQEPKLVVYCKRFGWKKWKMRGRPTLLDAEAVRDFAKNRPGRGYRIRLTMKQVNYTGR